MAKEKKSKRGKKGLFKKSSCCNEVKIVPKESKEKD